jgi:hypothetical protein
MSTNEAKSKDEKFLELAKKNELKHHLGMMGYAVRGRSGSSEKWRQKRSCRVTR